MNHSEQYIQMLLLHDQKKSFLSFIAIKKRVDEI